MPLLAPADYVETATRDIGGRWVGLTRRCGRIGGMAELNDGEGAFAYGDSILVGERVRLRGLRDDDLP